MLPSSSLTSFPRLKQPSTEHRCFGMSSVVPASNTSAAIGFTFSPSTATFRVGSPAGAGGTLSTSPGGGSGGCGSYASGVVTTYAYGVGSPTTTLAPDPHAQKAVIEQLLERTLSEGDFWYVVVAEWLEQLKKYLGIASTRKYYQKRGTTLPGPILTRRDFAHTVDVVHEDAWRMLISWYGLSEGHKPMKLVVYKYARGPEIEHNQNTFKLMLTTSPPEDFHNVRFSKMEKIGHLEWRLRQLYNIPTHQESRMWARADPESDWRLVLSRDKCIGRILEMDSDFTRPVLALELLSDDNIWNHPPEGVVDSVDLSALDSGDIPEDIGSSSAINQDFSSGHFYEYSIFDDITTSWELDIHDQIDHMGKNFMERLHSSFSVFVQRARDYVSDREATLRERERQISSRESVTERLVLRLEDKERRLAAELITCDEKIKDYERRRLELEQEMAERQERAERDLQERKEEVMKEAKALQADKEHFTQEMKKMEELNIVQEGRVKLDIGGHQFTTSLLTLTKESESMLAAMFSGRYNLKTEADGSYFIDRDGTHFRYILNYLRDGCIKEGTLPCSEAALRELLAEAEFYQLSGLVEILNSVLFKPYGKDGDTFV